MSRERNVVKIKRRLKKINDATCSTIDLRKERAIAPNIYFVMICQEEICSRLDYTYNDSM